MRESSSNCTIQDVAEQAGVSITTVSRVLNNNYPVKNETRDKVEAAIKELNFTPNILARGLIQKKTFTIGVLVPSITNLYFAMLVNGIQNYLREKNYQIFLFDTNGNPDMEVQGIKTFNERRVDGMISVDPRTATIKDGHYNRVSKECPLVLVNGYNDDVNLSFVLSDQVTGAREALQYLISLGHRNILFIRGLTSYSYDIKEEVYKNVLAEYGIPFRKDHVLRIESGNSIETLDMTAIAVSKLLTENSSDEVLTAVFACNDWMGVGAIQGAQKIGLTVPKDLSVIGYDNTIISEISTPKLTTVSQNMHELGESAAARLFEMITDIKTNTNNENSKIIINTDLIIRESCTKLIYSNSRKFEGG